MKKNVLLFAVVLLIAYPSQAQQESIKSFHEVSGSLGAGSNIGGTVIPYFNLLYTFGVDIGQYVGTGVSVGIDAGLSAQLTLRGKILLGDGGNGVYLMGNGGIGYWGQVIPVVSSSAGYWHQFKSGIALFAGPFFRKYYTQVDNPPGRNEKGWGNSLGVRIGFHF